MFLPGMMCDARLFAPQIAALSGTRSVMVCALSVQDSIEEMALDVLEQAPDRFALAGLSMGGIVAMEVLRQASERVARVALMDTNPHAEKPHVVAAREPHVAQVRAGGLAEVMRDEMKPRYLAPGPRRRDVLDQVLQMALDLGPEVFIRQSRALQTRPELEDVLARIRVPSLVLCGAHDALCPVSRHQFMADRIPGAHLVVIEDAGHLPTLETPDQVTDALQAWLQA